MNFIGIDFKGSNFAYSGLLVYGMRLGAFKCLGMDIRAFACVYGLADMERVDMGRRG
jgi:hypothetical protein